MDITPLRTHPQPPVPHAPAPAPQDGGPVPGGAGSEGAPAPELRRAAPAPLAAPGSRVTAEVSRPHPGQQVVSFVDSRTGEVISQLPAVQVLNVVMGFVEQIKRREADAVDHR